MHKGNLNRILTELWENAAFDSDANVLVEEIAESSGNISAHLLAKIQVELVALRNRKLITPENQTMLRTTTVGFFGLSVGSHAALTWSMQTRPDCVKIADPDTIDPTNLNRLRFGWNCVGHYKTDVVADQIISMSPNTNVISKIGTDYKTVKDIFDTSPKLDLVVDEVDDLQCKVWLRILAKERRIPLISATDIGDNLSLDIERYDLKPQPKPFLGRVEKLGLQDDLNNLPFTERVKISLQIVGLDDCSEAMLESLLAIGTTLKTWPQLGATSTMAGGLLTTTIKKIVLGENVESKRYRISLDKLLDSGYESSVRVKRRKELIKQIEKKFGL